MIFSCPPGLICTRVGGGNIGSAFKWGIQHFERKSYFCPISFSDWPGDAASAPGRSTLSFDPAADPADPDPDPAADPLEPLEDPGGEPFPPSMYCDHRPLTTLTTSSWCSGEYVWGGGGAAGGGGGFWGRCEEEEPLAGLTSTETLEAEAELWRLLLLLLRLLVTMVTSPSELAGTTEVIFAKRLWPPLNYVRYCTAILHLREEVGCCCRHLFPRKIGSPPYSHHYTTCLDALGIGQTLRRRRMPQNTFVRRQNTGGYENDARFIIRLSSSFF